MRRRPRVLVVDDEVPLRRLLRSLLVERGYVTRGAHDGEEALRRVRSFAPDLVVTNRNMPELKGEEFAARLLAECVETRLVVATGYWSEDVAQAFYHAGACAFLLKPFTTEAFFEVVSRTLCDPEQTILRLAALRRGASPPWDRPFSTWWEKPP